MFQFIWLNISVLQIDWCTNYCRQVSTLSSKYPKIPYLSSCVGAFLRVFLERISSCVHRAIVMFVVSFALLCRGINFYKLNGGK